MRRCLFLVAVIFIFIGASGIAAPGKREEVTLYRDTFGIPHVFAKTAEAAAYALGYAQAEDRLEELLKNYRRAAGTMAEVFGPQHYRNDYIQRMWRHALVAQEKYQRVSPKMRACLEAYIAGVKQFMKENPGKVPAWAQELHPWDPVALGRFIIYGWPLGEAAGDLQRGGIQPDPVAYRGSNEMLIAKSRTTVGGPIAVIDPHLSWYGEFRFYQERIYTRDLNVAGVAILGVPFPNLGHSRYCSVAMTTGGPDTSDIFVEEIDPANPRRYKVDGAWREMVVRREKIGVKKGETVDWVETEIEYSHHGPVVARRGSNAYVMAIPYADEIGLSDQMYRMFQAKNLEEMKQALGQLQLMSQNIMIGTVQGDLYYVRNGRVPIRAKGVDPSRPVPGNTSATEWQGIHPLTDLVQLTNPASGYMHNCNVSPFAMMKDSPLVPEKYADHPYLYNASRTQPRHQRGEMMTDLLEGATRVNLEQAIDITFNPQVWRAELWQERLVRAWEQAPAQTRSGAANDVFEMIRNWNRRSEAESEGAMAFYAFKKSLGPAAPAVEPPDSLTDEGLIGALGKAAEWLQVTFGSTRVAYGRYFRVGREGGKRTFPVGGGSLNGGPNNVAMATPRAIGFAPVGTEMVGRSGQTSTQIVVLTNPPESYTIVPLGHSDDPASPHWDDQAEKLFSRSKAAPTYFMRKKELLQHVTVTKKLVY